MTHLPDHPRPPESAATNSRHDAAGDIDIDAALVETEERLQLAIDAAELGTFYCPMPLGEIRWNAKCKEHFWLPPEATVDFDLFYSRLHPDDRERTRAAIDAVFAHRRPYDVEYRTVAPDGRERWIHARGRAFFDSLGKPLRFDGVTLDITHQKRLEEELRDAQMRLESTLSAAEVATWTWDLVSDRVVPDRNLAKLFGLPPGMAGGVPVDDYLAAIHADDRERVQNEIKHVIHHGHTLETECRLVRPDGSVRHVLARARLERDASGHAVELPGVLLDITDRVGADEARRTARTLLDRQSRVFDALLSSISDLTYIIDRQGRFQFANRPLLKLWGMSLEQVVNKTFADLRYPPKTVAQLEQHMAHVFATGQSITGEVAYTSPTGASGYFEHIFSPVLTVEGEVEFIAGSSRDISHRREAEQSLRASEARFRLLSEIGEATRDESDHEAVMRTIAERLGRHLQASRCAYADVGPDQDHFEILHDYTDGCPSSVGRFLLSDFGPRAAAAQRSGQTLVINDLDRELTAETGAQAFDSIGIKALICCPLIKSGRLVAMMAVHQTSPRQWTAAEVSLVEAIVERSWTYIQQARITRDLQQTNHRLQLAQRAGRVGVFDWLLTENRLIWSPELEHLYGLPEGGFEGTLADWRKRVVPEDAARVEADLQDCIRRRQVEYNYEFRIKLPDGQQRWAAAHSQFVYDAEGNAVRMVGVNVDITEQRRIAEVREKLLESERNARSDAERASHMKDEFLATLSHELRTPLNAIYGWAQILRMGTPSAEDLRTGLDTIERNARAQTQIIEDLLDMSRIISGKVRLDVHRVDLAAVVKASIETVRPAAEAKGVKIRAVLDPLAGPVSGDANRLQQVFWNLLSNAVKFTPRQGSVQVLLERVNSHLEVSVIDTGEGIKPDFLPFVFDRFRQADSSTTRRVGGLGLGLAIVKQLVELHGGSIRVKSLGEGQGSTFIVALPLTVLHYEADQDADRRHPAVGLSTMQLPDLSGAIAGVKVLVVDDEPDARALIHRLLSECGAKVVMAASADEAFRAIKWMPPDILVSDIGMPGEDGYSLIRRIRALPANEGGAMPAVALTAYARAEDRMRSIIAGFQMHIAKPVEPAELITMVATLAGRTPDLAT